MPIKRVKATHRRFIRIDGKRITARFASKSDADKWYAEKNREKELIENGMQVERKAISFREYSLNWLSARKAHGYPESSLITDSTRLRIHVLPVMGDRQLDRISRREWDSYFDKLINEHELSPATRNRVHSLVRKMYQDALRQDYVEINPITGIPKASEKETKWSFWESGGEIARYLKEAENECLPFWMFTLISLNTGARVGEILALRHQDIQLERRRIHIWKTYEQSTGKIVDRTKGGLSRWVGINDELYRAITEYKKKSPYTESGDFLLYSDDRFGERRERCLNPFSVRRRHKAVCERAGLRKIRVHDLRHTFASHYVMNGGGLPDLQKILGHSTFEMTLKYAHLAPGHLESKANVVNFSADKNVDEVSMLATVAHLSKSPGRS